LIQAAIDHKSIADYSMPGAESWLLVVGSAGTGGTLDTSDARGQFTSPFVKTVFLECFSGDCVVLQTRPAVAAEH
jgi:CO dehydrogenase/acetyl-CoA synthase gamma subunit (corrinoid Fe-S protein)